MPAPRLHIIQNALPVNERGIRQIAAVRVYTEIGRAYEVDIVHRFFDGIHKRGLHRLEAELHTTTCRHLSRTPEIAYKRCARLLRPLIIVDIVARELDGPNAKRDGKVNGIFHNLHAACPLYRVRVAERIFAVSAKTDRTEHHPCPPHGSTNLIHFFCLHLEPRELLVRLVNTHLHIVKPRILCSGQLLAPCKRHWHRLFVEPKLIAFFHDCPHSDGQKEEPPPATPPLK